MTSKLTNDQIRNAYEKFSFLVASHIKGTRCRGFTEGDLIDYTRHICEAALAAAAPSKHTRIAEAAWAFMKAYQYETAEQADAKRRELFRLVVESVRPR